jgi:aminopeptidase YwaD
MTGTALLNLLEGMLRGEHALAYTEEITRFHRAKGSSDYLEAIGFVRDKLVEWNLEKIVVERYPADGLTTYQTWTPPPAWEPVRAELSLVHPEDRHICSFETEPVCLVFGSTSTPSQGLILDVVDIGDGVGDQAYSGKEVYGKVVLTSGSSRNAFRFAVKKRGAIGVLTDYMPRQNPSIKRTPCDLPDAVSYASFPVTREDIGKTAFGFSLSLRQAQEIRRLLKNGPVKIKAEVEADLFPGEIQVLTGIIPGTEKSGEILIIAHLCHPKPGANDNASGCGLAMELARAMSAAIDQGKLARPKHSIRFMFVPEMYGTIAYLERYPGLSKRVKAAVNLDMVGEAREAMSSANLVSTPWSLPSALNDVTAFYMDLVARRGESFGRPEKGIAWLYDVAGFSGGSDHYILVDSSYGIPCVYLGHWPDRFYHTGMDTIQMVDKEELLRSGLVTAATALTFADPCQDNIKLMYGLVASGAGQRIAKCMDEAYLRTLTYSNQGKKKAEEAALNAYERGRILLEKELAAVDSVLRHVPKANVAEARKMAKMIKGNLRAIFKASYEKNRLITGIDDLARHGQVLKKSDSFQGQVYSRLFRGPLSLDYFYGRIDEKRREHYHKREKDDPVFHWRLVEVINFMDGKRTLGEIASLVSAEYPVLFPDDLKNFILDLKAAELISPVKET